MKRLSAPFALTTALLLATVGVVSSGCKTSPRCCAANPAPAATTQLPTLRIKTGAAAAIKDSRGNEWLPDQGFADGDIIERPDLKIEGTSEQAIYQAERYGMSRFTQALPNGKYLVKLHFAETFEGISGPGQRVFSFNVEGREFKDFDVWAKSGGFARAHVETVPVEITDQKLDITFTSNIENPEINGIEIIPGS